MKSTLFYKGYYLTETTRGGRAGKGFNETASIKVERQRRNNGQFTSQKICLKYFRFYRTFPHTKEAAIQKAKYFIDSITQEQIRKKTLKPKAK